MISYACKLVVALMTDGMYHVYMAPNKRLKQFRLKNEMSRTDLAYKLSCSYDMVRSIEVGRRKPGRELAALIEHLTFKDDRIEALDW